ncbi:hypothetical protein WJX73_004737 [Symbiochloris irregularis]|uniref:asparaginase n=1 Tax=Symbiochloris irregularis TaxID=706552 RepID=A0AAW1PRD5_9CHLO
MIAFHLPSPRRLAAFSTGVFRADIANHFLPYCQAACLATSVDHSSFPESSPGNGVLRQGDDGAATQPVVPLVHPGQAALDTPEASIRLLSEAGPETSRFGKRRKRKRKNPSEAVGPTQGPTQGPLIVVSKPLPRVLLVHTGGTLGMDPSASFAPDADGQNVLKKGTGGSFAGGLQPGDMLSNLRTVVPELSAFANLQLEVAFNRDSCRVGPQDWARLARLLHDNRPHYDAFLIVHGTDTMAYTASALSLMLLGFRKPVVITGSQLPLLNPRSDARQNLIDAVSCATAFFTPPHIYLEEVAVCFGGKLMRGNRTQKVNSTSYQAFDSPTYPALATLGTNVDWDQRFLLEVQGTYRPRFKLDPRVIRIPIVPGSDPRLAYGDLASRGVKGIVLEAFGVGNMPDTADAGWLPWLREQRSKGLQVYLTTQCVIGTLQPELYRSGSIALKMGVEAGPQMTPECAVVKMMQCLKYPDLPMTVPLAGEM